MRAHTAVVSIALAGLAPLILSALPPGPEFTKPDVAALDAGVVVATHSNATVTIEVDGERKDYKLAGVQAPASAPDTTASRLALAGMVEGEHVWYRADGKSAHVYRQPDGLYVNLEVVRVGRGEVASAGLTDEQRKTFAAYRERAKDRKVGMWEQVGTSPSSTTKTQPKSTQPTQTTPASDETVCVTKTGTKYHMCSCRHASKNGTQISLEDAKKRGLSPCSVCKPPT